MAAEGNGRLSPIEVTTRFATTVPTLADAWSFVMGHVDRVGTDPSIHITPYWSLPDDEDDEGRGSRFFEVSVEGMVPAPDNVIQ